MGTDAIAEIMGAAVLVDGDMEAATADAYEIQLSTDMGSNSYANQSLGKDSSIKHSGARSLRITTDYGWETPDSGFWRNCSSGHWVRWVDESYIVPVSDYHVHGWVRRDVNGESHGAGIDIRYCAAGLPLWQVPALSTILWSMPDASGIWYEFGVTVPAGKVLVFMGWNAWVSPDAEGFYTTGSGTSDFYFDDVTSVSLGLRMAGESGDTNRRYKWWAL